MKQFNLTEYSHGAGCGCKIDAEKLSEILKNNKSSIDFKNLLVGNHTNDDAAVWDLENGMALVSTLDFFTPIVNNAFDFGRIAAANAISDIYAMGAKPIFANAILGWPIEKLPLELASEIIAGANEICKQANIPIAGGHSIDSQEPIFGLAVNGICKKQNIKQNSNAQNGDLLFMTKPLGTGIIGTAIKRNLIEDGKHLKEVVESMCKLNSIGYEIAKMEGINALTDVTGFGLIGHLIEMAKGANLSIDLFYKKVPYFSFLDSYLTKNIIPDNTYRNWNAHEKLVNNLTEMKAFQILNDPQTSGGLLISVSQEKKADLIELFIQNNLENHIEPIGIFKAKNDFCIDVIF